LLGVNPAWVSDRNRAEPAATAGEFAPLALGDLRVWPPVVLAPMAGITNYPFRSVCREQGAGLFVSEMITARPLVEGNAKTLRLAEFGPDERPRSLQLYGVDPHHVGEATRRLVGEGAVDHIDMNFGCPVPKVTRRGGGSAIPVKPRLLARIVRAAVQNAGDVPVTIKFRMGIDDDLLTFRDAGHVGEAEGCAAVGLHARTAVQLYAGEARWDAITELKATVRTIPVLGNGDIWEAHDALRMMRSTGCDGVIVGRGCLGRPWLFHDLARVFAGHAPARPPDFGGVARVILEHARRLVAWTQRGVEAQRLDAAERAAMRAFRKHTSWYTKGFRASAELRQVLMQVDRVEDLERILTQANANEPFPVDALRAVRGKRGRAQRVALPHGYLDDRYDDTPPEPAAEAAVSGG